MARYTKGGKTLKGLQQALHWVLQGIAGKDYADSAFDAIDNALATYTGSSMTQREREKADYEDAISDDNADIAYQRTRELTQDFGPSWQIQQTKLGYESAGLNPMMMAGISPGASGGTSAPLSSGGSAGGLQSSSMIESLIAAAFQKKKLDIEQQHVDNETKETDAKVESLNIENANLQDLLDLQKGELSKKIEFMGQQIETEPVKRALLKTEIGLRQAQTAVQENMAALQKIDLKYHDAYQAAQLGIAQAYRALQETQSKYQEKLLLQQIGINAKQIEIMNQTIITGKLEAGLLAKQFQYYDSDRKFNRWNIGIGTAVKAVGAVAGLAVGAGSFGKAAGLFGSAAPNRYGYDVAPVGW